jgi:methylated-DNA-[protein]-cysteine S-methyltransferase
MHADDAIAVTVLDTPIGPLSLLAHDGALVGGGFTADPAQLHVRMQPSLRTLSLIAARPDDLPWLVKPIRDYFGGDLGALDTIVVRQPGTPTRQQFYATLRTVAPGTTVSYADLARQVGRPRAPRAAGAACAANLIAPVVPCHRVLRGDGSLGGYYYGLSRKEWLLRHEGAPGR